MFAQPDAPRSQRYSTAVTASSARSAGRTHAGSASGPRHSRSTPRLGAGGRRRRRSATRRARRSRPHEVGLTVVMRRAPSEPARSARRWTDHAVEQRRTARATARRTPRGSRAGARSTAHDVDHAGGRDATRATATVDSDEPGERQRPERHDLARQVAAAGSRPTPSAGSRGTTARCRSTPRSRWPTRPARPHRARARRGPRR